jgi:hypothetical protein
LRKNLPPADRLLLNAQHDRTFYQDRITIDEQHRIHVSKLVHHNEANDKLIWSFARAPINEPKCFPPSPNFIENHNGVILKPS